MVFSWEMVAPGMVTAEPRSFWYLSGARRPGDSSRNDALALSTEDRHLRLFDSTGEMVRDLRLGFRSATHLFQEPGGTILAIDSRGRVLRGSFERGLTWPVASLAKAPRFVWRDPSGNILVFGENREIFQKSAAGKLLWMRSMPASLSGAVPLGPFLFAALENGRIFRFDESGRGSSFFSFPFPLDSFAATVFRGRLLMAASSFDGSLSLVKSDGPNPEVIRQKWRRASSGRSRFLGFDNEGRLWYLEGGRLQVVGPEGESRGSVVVHLLDPDLVVLDSHRGRAFLVDQDRRLLTLTSRGVVDASFQLAHRPEKITLLPSLGQLVVLYRDWRVQVFRIGSGAGEVREMPRHPSWRSTEGAAGGALAQLASTVFSGGARGERERLFTLGQELLDDARLSGHVTTFRSMSITALEEVRRGRDFPEIRLRAVALLASLLDGPSRAALASAVDDPDARVASRAMSALALYGADDFGALQRGYLRFSASSAGDQKTLAPGLAELVHILSDRRDGVFLSPENERLLHRAALALESIQG